MIKLSQKSQVEFSFAFILPVCEGQNGLATHQLVQVAEMDSDCVERGFGTILSATLFVNLLRCEGK